VVVVEDKLTIGYLDIGPGVPGLLGEIVDFALRFLIGVEAPSNVKNMANALIPAIIANNWNDGTTVLFEQLLFNYTLTNQPLFTDDHMTFYLDGGLNITGSGVNSCPYVRAPIPPAQSSGDLQIALDLSTIECVIYQLVVEQTMSRQLSLNGMFSFDVTTSQPPLISVVQSVLSLGLGLDIAIKKPISSGIVPWISLVGNATISLEIQFQLSNISGASYVNFSFPLPLLQVDNISCPFQNSDVPLRYRDQILHENWNVDVSTVNNLINNALAGRLPPFIPIPLPDTAATVVGYFGGIQFTSTTHSVTVILDFISP